MLYSTGAEYAIRAMAFLASRAQNGPSSLKDIVGGNGLRSPFMAKTLHQLVKRKLVASQKGPGGGFALAQDPKELTLLDIVRAIDGDLDFTRCAVGMARCSSEMPCPLHDSWKQVRENIRTYMDTQTLDKLALAVEKKLEYLKKKTKSGV